MPILDTKEDRRLRHLRDEHGTYSAAVIYSLETQLAESKADEWKKPTDDWPAHSEPVMGWNPYWQDAGNETGIRECFRNAGGDEWLSAVFQEGDDYYQTGDDRPWLCRAYPEPPKEQDDDQ